MSRGPARWLALLLTLQMQTAALAQAPTAAPPSATLAPLQARLDELTQRGMDEPDAVLAQLARTPATDAAERRVVALAQGLVAAGAGRVDAASTALSTLSALAASDPLAGADAATVRATLADLQGQPALALQAARAAL